MSARKRYGSFYNKKSLTAIRVALDRHLKSPPLISKYLSHLNPESSNLFQKPRSACMSFNPAKDSVWYCSVPLGHNTVENMLRGMTTRAGIQPYLTNHSIRATTVTILSAANYECRHLKAITGHRSEARIELKQHSNFHAVESFVKRAWQLCRFWSLYR